MSFNLYSHGATKYELGPKNHDWYSLKFSLFINVIRHIVIQFVFPQSYIHFTDAFIWERRRCSLSEIGKPREAKQKKLYPTFSDFHPDSISKANSSKVYFAKLYICKNISDVPFQIGKLREAKQNIFYPTFWGGSQTLIWNFEIKFF